MSGAIKIDPPPDWLEVHLWRRYRRHVYVTIAVIALWRILR